jgi:hypothetical protein
LDKVPPNLFGNLKQIEKECGQEIAMVGHHNSKTMFVMLAVEEGVSDLSPMEYLKIIKEINTSILHDTVNNN